MKPWRRLLSVMTAAALFCMAVPVSAAELTPGDGALPKNVVIGDANGDGKVDTTDARLILQHAVGKIQLDIAILPQADADGNGEVDTTDARLVLQFAVNKISKFPKPVEREIDFEVLRYITCYSTPSNLDDVLIIHSADELANFYEIMPRLPEVPDLEEDFFVDQAVIVIQIKQGLSTMRTIINKLTAKKNHLTLYTATGYPGEGVDGSTNFLLLSISNIDIKAILTYSKKDTPIAFCGDGTAFYDWFYSWLNVRGCEKEEFEIWNQWT